MSATSIDLSQIKTDALSAASTFRTLIGLGTLATQSPTGTANSTTYLRGDFTWATVSGSAAWGSITGTLSSQTDLQSALDAKASLSGATFTGRITTPSVLLSGNYSSTAWTTNGVGLSHTTRTLTDTSSTGTVATAYTNVLGGNTIAASNATTFTDYASLFIGSPTAGTNVTISNAFSLITQGAVRIGGQLLLTNALSVANGGTGSTTASGAANAILPSQTSNSGKYLTTDGSNVSWGSASAAVMTGATASTSGSSGSVPTPAAGQEELMLTGAGTFHVPSLPIVKSETTRGTSTSRWLSAPFAQDAGAGSSGGANFEFCGAFLYVPYTGSYYFATIPAAAYSGSTKTSWALYNLASDGLPGTLAVTLGELDVGSGANVLCQSASTVSLTKGWYCCVHRANGSFNLWAPQSHAWLNYTYGKITADISNVSAAGKRRFYRALTYSTSFASDLTSQTWSEDNNASPCCWIRRG